jgi:hypothetical protein
MQTRSSQCHEVGALVGISLCLRKKWVYFCGLKSSCKSYITFELACRTA